MALFALRRGRNWFGPMLAILALAAFPGPGFSQRGGGGGHGGGGHYSSGLGQVSPGSRAFAPTSSEYRGMSGNYSERNEVRGNWDGPVASRSRRMGAAVLWGRNGAGRDRAWLPPHAFEREQGWHHRPPLFVAGFFRRGFGESFLGLWFGYFPDCEPLSDGTLPPGCNTFGYWGGYGIGPTSGEDEEYSSNASQPDEGDGDPSEGDLQDSIHNVYEPGPQTLYEVRQNEHAKPLTLLYLKSGFSYGATDYWITGGELHYVTSYGGENAISVDQLDLDRTVNENASRGVPFLSRQGPERGSRR
jgi:hypothetical protein